MGRVYLVQKPKLTLPVHIIDGIAIFISNKVSVEQSQQLRILLAEAKSSIQEDINDYSDKALLEDYVEKDIIKFKIALALDAKSVIGYAISFCQLDQLSNYYLDQLFVAESYRKKGIGLALLLNLINTISYDSQIVQIKLITQDDNVDMIRLIEKIMSLCSDI